MKLTKEEREERNKYYKKWRKDNRKKVKKYYRDNKDKRNKQSKKWREKNKERMKEYKKNNKEKTKRDSKKYRENNKDKVKVRNDTYNLIKQQGIPQYGICPDCKKIRKLETHHIKYTRDEFILLCKACHLKKHLENQKEGKSEK